MDPYASIQVPVILVGNKIDLRGGEVTNEALEGEVLPIMNEFKVRCVVHTTAYLTVSLGSRHLRGVLGAGPPQRPGGILPRPESGHTSGGTSIRLTGSRTPSSYCSIIASLIVYTTQVLKRECVAALRRIFKLCDTNKDGVLDTAELNEFQVCLAIR